jgi:hypothetical protein
MPPWTRARRAALTRHLRFVIVDSRLNRAIGDLRLIGDSTGIVVLAARDQWPIANANRQSPIANRESRIANH